MRRIILSEYVTLDGVILDPRDWHRAWWSDDLAAWKLREALESSALLLGRATWEGLAASNPRGGDMPGLNSTLPTYVVSTTLHDAGGWPNVHFLRTLADVARLREGEGGDIMVHGSADLARSLMEANLIDEYRLLVFPLVPGTGKRLFNEQHLMNSLILTASEPFPNGVVALTYSPAEDAIPSLAELDLATAA